MSLRRALWVSAGAFVVFLLLWFLRLFHVLGSEADILIRWVSTVSLILCGVLIGLLISEKKVQVKGMLASLILVTVGFFSAPFVGIAVLVTFPFSRGNETIVFGGSIVVFLLLYIGLLLWLRKRGWFRLT